jgi:uncharacterized protein YqgC (DUF456 family)
VFASLAAFAICLGALVVNGVGVVLTLLQLPGNWLIVFTTALVAWWGWDPLPEARLVGWAVLGVLLGLALAAELAELALSALGARKAGGSRRGALYAVLGGIAGAIAGSFLIPILIVGTVAGAALGSGLGAYLGDRAAGRAPEEAARAARGAAVGRLSATAVKGFTAVLLWCVALGAFAF